MFPPVQHDGAVAVPKRISQVHITVQEGGRAEAMAFGGTGGKGGKLKGIQHLRAHPQDGPIFQIPGDSTIGGGLWLAGGDTKSDEGSGGLKENFEDTE